MSINKNIKNSQFKEVTIQNDIVGKAQLLKDLVNDTSDEKTKIIASIFLLGKSSSTEEFSFLILKPKCLWLSKSGGVLKDASGSTSGNIAAFLEYKNSEVIKASYLLTPHTVYSVLTSAGLTGLAAPVNGVEQELIHGLSHIFMYDINELNRTRSASISTTGNASLNSIWL